MSETLVLLELDAGSVKRASLSAIALARSLEQAYSILLIGSGIAEAAISVAGYGAAAVLAADHEDLALPLADRYAALLAQVARSRGSNRIVATSSTFSKDILPRAAALLDLPMLTDVLAVERGADGMIQYRRPISAGSLIATVRLAGAGAVLSARGTAFSPPERENASSPIESVEIDAANLPNGSEYISREQKRSERPDVTEARVVVGGGRPMKDKETFERLAGGLADVLGGGLGATRGAVDSGMAPNDWQIGQTGKVIAPDLYFALGISGAIQHSAGVKDAKTIVAINTDPDAPIFQLATYGLVADIHKAVPELIDAIRKSRSETK